MIYVVVPGGLLASVYHLTRIEYGMDRPKETCRKVFSLRKIPQINFVYFLGLERFGFSGMGVF